MPHFEILRYLVSQEVLDRNLSKLLKNLESLHTLQKSIVLLQFVTFWRSRETHKCNFFSFSLWDQFLVFVLLKVHCYSQNDVSCGRGVATSNVPFSRLDLLFSVWLSFDYTDFDSNLKIYLYQYDVCSPLLSNWLIWSLRKFHWMNSLNHKYRKTSLISRPLC